MQLGWDLIPYRPYSPDIAPPDFYLFRFLHNSLMTQMTCQLFVIDNEETIKDTELYFISKDFIKREFLNYLKDGKRL